MVRQDFPRGGPKIQRALARGHGYLGDVYLAQGKYEPALQEYQHSLEARETLANQDPLDDERQFQLARGLSNFGDLHREKGDDNELPAGIKAYEKALTIRESLVLRNPDVSEYATDLGRNYLRLASLYERQKRRDVAKDFVQQARRIYIEQEKRNSKVTAVLIGLAEVYLFFGFFDVKDDNPSAARDNLAKGMDYYRQIDDTQFDRNDWFRLAACHSLLSKIDREKAGAHLKEAKDCLRRAVKAGYINLDRLESGGFDAIHDADFDQFRDELQAEVLKHK
jgi:tetratricopeptide (TPR) repeat protein